MSQKLPPYYRSKEGLLYCLTELAVLEELHNSGEVLMSTVYFLRPVGVGLNLVSTPPGHPKSTIEIDWEYDPDA